MNIADFLARQYVGPPCWLLVADVLGPVPEFVPPDGSIAAVAGVFRRALHDGQHGFVRVDAPVEGCVVLMARRAANTPHHCGVYLGGKVLHALPGGNLYQDMASLRDTYGKIEFWARP